jgi:hypothetical protein
MVVSDGEVDGAVLLVLIYRSLVLISISSSLLPNSALSLIIASSTALLLPPPPIQ